MAEFGTPRFLVVPAVVFLEKKYLENLRGLIDTGTYPTYIDEKKILEKFGRNKSWKIGELPDVDPVTGESKSVSYTTATVEIFINDKKVRAEKLLIFVDELKEPDKFYDMLIAPDIFEKTKSKLLLDFEKEKVSLIN